MPHSPRPLPPFSKIVVEDAVPADLFTQLLRLSSGVAAVGSKPGYTDWISGWWPVDRKPACVVDRVARSLLPLVSGTFLAELENGQRVRAAPVIVGAEWWLRATTCDEEHPSHVDKDEETWTRDGVLRHPFYGTVLYLTPEGGPTVIYDQALLTENVDGSGGLVGFYPQDDQVEKITVFPKLNTYTVFPGWAKHEVMPVSYPGVRRTLLLNWWCVRPAGMPDGPTFLPNERS